MQAGQPRQRRRRPPAKASASPPPPSPPPPARRSTSRPPTSRSIRDGQTLGTYLVSNLIDQFRKPFFGPQEVKVGDKTSLIQLRFKRLYKPYTIHLLDFRFDRYPGTDVAKNFSSDVRSSTRSRNVDRKVRIWMNNPLRYAGETFFQADWNKQTERGTVLQIVRNPAWSMPYLALRDRRGGTGDSLRDHADQFHSQAQCDGASDCCDATATTAPG